MAYITPNSTVWLLSGVNLEPSYTHTLYCQDFSTVPLSRNAQFNAFTTGVYLKYTLTNYSYQRRGRNYIRVKKKIEDLYDCNYMIFKNTSYEDRYFYAFITNAKYINDNTTELTYEIDVIQTWWFDYTLNQCFVERETSETDEIGENLLPEPVSIGEYVYERKSFAPISRNKTSSLPYILICVASDPTQQTGISAAKGTFEGGTYQAIGYRYYSCASADLQNTINNITDYLNTLAIFNRTNTVINMIMVPNGMIPYGAVDGNNTSAVYTPQSYANSIVSATIATYDNTDLGMYHTYGRGQGAWTPKNNKLFTYPYCFFIGTNNQGTTIEYKYEYFSSPPSFRMVCDFSPNPTVAMIPIDYMQELVDAEEDFSHALTITNFPQCSWATNDLVAKMIQATMGLATAATLRKHVPLLYQGEHEGGGRIGNQFSFNQSYQGKRLSGNENWVTMEDAYEGQRYGGTIKSGLADGAVKELGKDLIRTSSAIGYSLMNTHILNSAGNGNILQASGNFEFTFKEVHIRTDFAKVIDDFFTMYGYQTNRIKVPNRNVRPFWTYTKTTNCTIDGKMPMEDAEKIQDIYNNGITFWTALGNIGNYSLNNGVPVG